MFATFFSLDKIVFLWSAFRNRNEYYATDFKRFATDETT